MLRCKDYGVLILATFQELMFYSTALDAFLHEEC